jgi:myosin protein heavy chain
VTPGGEVTDETENEDVGTGSPIGGGANNSIVSTASSHDLTVHLRANASFDPIMGLQGQGGGVGRFNAGKLNTYLHGLNRKLQEENEILVKTLKQQQEESLQLREKLMAKEDFNRTTEDSREKGDALQFRVDELQAALESKEDELSKLQIELADERGERARDKERWKDRMVEVERGVGDIVRDLEVRLLEAEEKVKECEERTEEERAKAKVAEEECEETRERLKLAEEELKAREDDEEGRDEDLRSLIKEKADAQREAKNLSKKVEELGMELEEERTQREVADKEVLVLKERTERLQEEADAALQSKTSEADENVRRLEDQLEEYELELKSLRRCKFDLESQVATAEEKVELLQEQLSNAHDDVLEAKTALEEREDEMREYELNTKRKAEAIRELEETLGEREKEVEGYLEEIADLKTKIAAREARSREISSVTDVEVDRSRESAAIQALQDELCEANREIGRLKATLEHSQSPTSKARMMAKEERIAELEKENEELQMQIQLQVAGLKDKSMMSMATPRRRVSFGGVSPMYRQLMNMTLKTPRTPGEPLKDVS